MFVSFAPLIPLLLLVGTAARRLEHGALDDGSDFVSMRILGLAGVALAWVVLSVEAYDYFLVQIDRPPGLDTAVTFAAPRAGRSAFPTLEPSVSETKRIPASVTTATPSAAMFRARRTRRGSSMPDG